MNKYISVVVFYVLAMANASACSLPAQGTTWKYDELIKNTETILLVTPIGEGKNSHFKVLELIKGKSEAEIRWLYFRAKHPHHSEDFNLHNNELFWAEGDITVIRSPFSSGSCRPQFTFVENENYLIFVESSGHPHSAEIIKSKDDKWYQYVKEKVTHNNAFLPIRRVNAPHG